LLPVRAGRIGQPLIAELIRRGRAVTGMSRSVTAAKSLVELGATVASVDAFDGAAVEISRHKNRVFISEVFRFEELGVGLMGPGLYKVFFRDMEIGELNSEELREEWSETADECGLSRQLRTPGRIVSEKPTRTKTYWESTGGPQLLNVSHEVD
jgi:hypothetical protein